jgi:hypothetical protein
MRREPGRRDRAWSLGLDEQDIYGGMRLAELRNFIETLLKPHGASRPRAENAHFRKPLGRRPADALRSQDRGQHTDRDPFA